MHKQAEFAEMKSPRPEPSAGDPSPEIRPHPANTDRNAVTGRFLPGVSRPAGPGRPKDLLTQGRALLGSGGLLELVRHAAECLATGYVKHAHPETKAVTWTKLQPKDLNACRQFLADRLGLPVLTATMDLTPKEDAPQYDTSNLGLDEAREYLRLRAKIYGASRPRPADDDSPPSLQVIDGNAAPLESTP
jgi:hypothetical protein